MSARRRRATRRGLVLAFVLALTVASGVAVWVLKPWGVRAQDLAPAGTVHDADLVTVPVERAALTDQVRLNATLGYGEPTELGSAPGIITALPAAGDIIKPGESVYEVDGRPVILMRGKRPFWRELASGMRSGPDVLQLEKNLAKLGFFVQEPDERFTWWTFDAIRRWQKDLDVEVTGSVRPADIVAVDARSVRVAQVTASLGEKDVSPLTYTATKLHATAKLTSAQARELRPGTPVTVILPDGTELENELAAVDPGGAPTDKEGETTPPTARIEFPDQDEVSEAGPTGVRVIVRSEEEAAETLVVPVTALIATAQDRYAVEVRTSDGTVRVPVEIGLVADARVQVIASGPEVEGAPADARALEAGDEVVISR